MEDGLLTVAEMKWFAKQAADFLTHDERNALVDTLAADPESGDLIEGTGGFRKLRWRRAGMGKSGGLRVIYYYYNPHYPLLLATLYAKNEKDNLTKSERHALARIGEAFIQSYQNRVDRKKHH